MVVAAGLHLHEHHLIAVHCNDVDVAVARFPVAVDDDIPLLLQVSLGQFLAPFAQMIMLCHNIEFVYKDTI